MGRFFLFFIVGFMLAISFWGSLAPKPEHKPVGLDSMPAEVRSYVCQDYTNDAYPVSVVRTLKESSYSLYEVTCSDGNVVPASW